MAGISCCSHVVWRLFQPCSRLAFLYGSEWFSKQYRVSPVAVLVQTAGSTLVVIASGRVSGIYSRDLVMVYLCLQLVDIWDRRIQVSTFHLEQRQFPDDFANQQLWDDRKSIIAKGRGSWRHHFIVNDGTVFCSMPLDKSNVWPANAWSCRWLDRLPTVKIPARADEIQFLQSIPSWTHKTKLELSSVGDAFLLFLRDTLSSG